MRCLQYFVSVPRMLWHATRNYIINWLQHDTFCGGGGEGGVLRLITTTRMPEKVSWRRNGNGDFIRRQDGHQDDDKKQAQKGAWHGGKFRERTRNDYISPGVVVCVCVCVCSCVQDVNGAKWVGKTAEAMSIQGRKEMGGGGAGGWEGDDGGEKKRGRNTTAGKDEKDTHCRWTAFLSSSTNCRAQERRRLSHRHRRTSQNRTWFRQSPRKDERHEPLSRAPAGPAHPAYVHTHTHTHTINSHKRNALKLEQTVIALEQLTHTRFHHRHYILPPICPCPCPCHAPSPPT